MWTWASGRQRRQAERRAAARLVTDAILEIRLLAGQGPEHLNRIHQLADIVHNLPGGVLGGGERSTEPYGYHTFRWMWETASPEQREWLIGEFEALGYDYFYLNKRPSPARKKPVRRSRSAKRVDAATLLAFDSTAAHEIHHADPGAVHVLIPRGSEEPRFHPDEPSMSEFNCLLQMTDGEIILVHLRFETALFEALPTRRRSLRWTTPDRDGYLWRRGHEPDNCPVCLDETH